MKKAMVVGAIVVVIATSLSFALKKQPVAPQPAPASIQMADGTAGAVDESLQPPEASGSKNAQDASTEVLLVNETGDEPRPDHSDAGLGGLVIAGRVVDRKNQPIEGVLVQVSGQGAGIITQTPKDGSFRLKGLLPGIYTGSADATCCYTGKALEDIEAGTEDLLIILEDLATIEGKVVDARTGAAVPKFEIRWQRGFASAVNDGSLRYGVSVNDLSGHFKLSDISLGDNTLIVRASGYITDFTPVSLISGDALRDVRIALETGRIAHGRVVDRVGIPVPGARLYSDEWALRMQFIPDANSSGRRAAEAVLAGTSGEDGAFTATMLDGTEDRLYAFHQEKGSGQAELMWSDSPDTDELTIILESTRAAVDVRVTISDLPAKGSFVFVGPPDNPHGHTYGSGLTDDDGRIHFSDLPSGEAQIVAGLPGAEGWRRRIWMTRLIEPGGTLAIPINFDSENAAVEGGVHLGEELPKSGQISLMYNRKNEREELHFPIYTGGNFNISNVVPGEAILLAQARFESRSYTKSFPITVVAGENPPQDIDFAGGGRIEGTVLGVSPLTRATVSAYYGEADILTESDESAESFAGRLEGYAEVDADGTYFIDNLSPGKYTLRMQVAKSSHIVRPDDLWIADEITLEVQGGETTVANFDAGE